VSGRFGTDGIRGRYGREVTEAVARAVGGAVVHALGPRVAVARDTRPSGPALEEALVEGIVGAGGSAVSYGVLPTPALSVLAAVHGSYDAAIMLTASHNPAVDNGLKVMGPDGGKLAAAGRAAVEAGLAGVPLRPGGQARADGTGSATYLDWAWARHGRALAGLHLVVDAANGAGAELAPTVLRALGARVDVLGGADGRLINDRCGALHPEALRAAVQASGADAGVALDGDGDRLVLVDADGRTLDGDALLWLLAEGEVVVGTVMSNLGLERGLGGRGIRLVRTAVGDAEVAAGMQSTGARVGGEPSGHVLLAGGAPTADALDVAIAVLAKGPIGPRLAGYAPSAQHHRTLPRADVPDLGRVPALVARAAAAGGRAVIRPSGTEPIVRVMVEHPDPAGGAGLVEELVAGLRGG